VLEGGTSCTSLSGHSARRSAMLGVVWCYKARGDEEHYLWKYWPPEVCIKQWYDKPEGMVVSARGVSWWSNEAVSLMCLVTWPSTMTYRVKTQDSKHSWFTTLMIFFIHTADNCLLPLEFLRSVRILSGCVAKKIWSRLVLDPLYIIHTLGFITPKLLRICLMIVAPLVVFQAWIWLWVGILKCLIFMQIMHMF